MPAHAGIQVLTRHSLDSRFRGNDTAIIDPLLSTVVNYWRLET
jgi:hypothetical protein